MILIYFPWILPPLLCMFCSLNNNNNILYIILPRVFKFSIYAIITNNVCTRVWKMNWNGIKYVWEIKYTDNQVGRVWDLKPCRYIIKRKARTLEFINTRQMDVSKLFAIFFQLKYPPENECNDMEIYQFNYFIIYPELSSLLDVYHLPLPTSYILPQFTINQAVWSEIVSHRRSDWRCTWTLSLPH